MFSWIHYPGLLGPGKRAMRGSVFWTLACCVILSGVVYSLSVTARGVQAQDSGNDSGSDDRPVQSPECQAASDRLQEASTAQRRGEIDSIPPDVIADYANECLTEGETTIEFSGEESSGGIPQGTKIIIGYGVGSAVVGGGVAYIAYVSYKFQRGGANYAQAEAAARAYINAGLRAQQVGNTPSQARLAAAHAAAHATTNLQAMSAYDEIALQERRQRNNPQPNQQPEAGNEIELRDFGNPQNGTGGNTQTPAGQGQQPQDARERPEGERPEGDTQSGNTCGPSQPVSLMKSDPLAPPVAPSEPVSLMKSNLSAQSVAPPLSEQCRERAEQERAEQEARDKGSKSPPRVGAPAKVAGGAGAGIAGDALEDFIGGVEESQNTDKVAEELRTKVSEQYPGYNVMVIQEETYDEPENIQGVQTNFTETIGGNVWDVWVFESGTFTNEGDLGYNNWVFSGNFELSGDDGETVTFSLEETEPEPEPLEGEEREDFLKGVDGPSGSAEHAKGLMRKLKERYPGYNVMVIQQETYEEPENLQGTLMTFPISPQFDQNPWDVWVFESGTFTNEGDLGYNNWVFSGNFERSGDDGETVTFESIEQ